MTLLVSYDRMTKKIKPMKKKSKIAVEAKREKPASERFFALNNLKVALEA